MNIVISCHIDTVFKHPYARVANGIFEGACDNFAPLMAVPSLFDIPDVVIELTEDEEMYMDGARYVAKEWSPQDTLIIVLDVTEAAGRANIDFTVENWYGIMDKHIKKALKGFKYKMIKDGSESEAWLYREFGFPVIEIDVPVKGGAHNLKSKTRVEHINKVSDALRALIMYFKDKKRSEISDVYDVGQ
jgi:hypothetical protein